MLLDVSRLMGRTHRDLLRTGVDRVCLAYIDRFGDRAQAVVHWRGWRRILRPDTSQKVFQLLRSPTEAFSNDVGNTLFRAFVSPWPSQNAKGRIYINPGHSGLDEPELGRWLARTNASPVFMVHDLIPITHPEYCRPGESQRHKQRLETILGNGRAIIANSAATLSELERFVSSRGLRMPAAVAAPLAPAALPFQRSTSPPLNRPYFVVVGTLEPRKNHLLLLQLWRELVQRLGDEAPHLVVIGQRGWECENIVDLLERCEALREHVHELSSCSDEQMACYVKHARALLFPSFAEGYGLPLIEALALGTPVIATDLPSFREIAGAVPDYLHPLDGHGWTQAVRDYAAPGSTRRLAQLERLAGWRAPSWDDHFEPVERLLQELG